MKVTATGIIAEPSPDTAGLAVTATCTRSFAGRPESVGAARAWVAGFLPGSPAADDVALLTSELVTNAVLHSASRLPGGIVTVGVRTGNGSVRVDVIDQGDVLPCFAAPHGLGKGLEIVSQLADVFGADGPDRWFSLRYRSDETADLAPADEACPWCGAISWGQTPDGRSECTRCLWSEPAS